jgi:hypothetical protein
MLTVGSDKLQPSVRQTGGQIVIGNDKFYTVPLSAQRAVRFDGTGVGGPTVQGVKRVGEHLTAGPVSDHTLPV